MCIKTSSATPTNASVPDPGSGSRLLFYPGKAALRAGAVNWHHGLKTFYGVTHLEVGDVYARELQQLFQ